MSSETDASRAMVSLDGAAIPSDPSDSPRSTALVSQSQPGDGDLSKWQIISAFDYDALDADLSDSLREQASRLRRRITKSTQDLIDIGSELKAAKARLEHGQFVKWVEAEVGIRRRTAQRYMRVADLSVKSDTVTLLTPTCAGLISQKGVSHEIAEAVLRKVELGELVTDQAVAQFVRSHQQRGITHVVENVSAPGSKRQPGEIEKHDRPATEIDARSAARTLLLALGPELARLVCETLGRESQAILAEMQTLLSTDVSAAEVRPQTLIDAPANVGDARNSQPTPRPQNRAPDIPTFLDRRTARTADEIVADIRAHKSRSD